MGGSVRKTTQEQTSAPAPEAMAYYKDLLKRLKGFQDIQYTPYAGQRVAEFTPYQQMAMQGVQNLQGAGMGTLQEAIEAGRRGTQPITTADIQRYQNPYQTMMIDAFSDIMRQQEAEDISKLQGTSISSGAFGGDRAKLAQAQMMRNQAQERNARISDLMRKGYSESVANAQADREAQARGATQLSSLASQQLSQPLSAINALYGMGSAQQALEQQKLNVPYEQYLEERAYPFQLYGFESGQATGIGSQMGGTSSGVTKQPGPSLFSQLLGAGTALGSAFLMSDEKLKENIEDVGVTKDGQTIYKYNYKGDPRTHLGLIAQEVEHKHPEAVKNVAGFKYVNYDLATKDSVHKADGGGLSDPFTGKTGMFEKGFIPAMSPVRGQGAPRGSAPESSASDNSAKSMVDSALDLASALKNRNTDTTNPASWGTTVNYAPEISPSGWETSVSQPLEYAQPSYLSKLGSYFGFAHGGGVNIPYKQGGGSTSPGIVDYYKYLADNPKLPFSSSEDVDPGIVDYYRFLAGAPKKDKPTITPRSNVPSIRTQEEDSQFKSPKMETSGYTTVDLNRLVDKNLSEDTMPWQTSVTKNTLPEIEINQPPSEPPVSGISEPYGEKSAVAGKSGGGLFDGFQLSPEAAQSLMTAGLAMMAGESPSALSNIGAGGLAGMKYYSELMEAKKQQALKEKEIASKSGDKNLVGTKYVTEDGDPIRVDTKTGIYYDENGQPLPEGTKKFHEKTLIIPEAIVKNVGEAGGTVKSLDRLKETFSDEFGGYKSKWLGNIVSAAGQNLISDPSSPYFKMGQWWQDYNDFANKVRKALFGATLTRSEEAAFDRAYINPGQSPETIKANLGRQLQAARSALYKVMDAQSSQGYNKGTLAKSSGYDLEELKTALDEFETQKVSGPETTGQVNKKLETGPHGKKVEQEGKTYIWNVEKQDYVEKQD